MPLVYFLDANDVPVALGDAYATVQNIEDNLTFSNSCASWNNLTTRQKENYIKAITRRIDSKYTFWGLVVDDTTPQPLKFPREKIGDLDTFSIEHQKAMLINYIAIIIEYELTKTPIGPHSLSQGAMAFVGRQQPTPREAIMIISQYVRQ